MNHPTIPHQVAIKWILRYLKATIYHGLLLFRSSTLTLNVYSVPDQTGCLDDRKSTGGFCNFLCLDLISWNARKQPIVSQSSIEAEYMALATTTATVELIWLQSLFKELYIFLSPKLVLWCNSIGATYLSTNPAFHAKTNTQIYFLFMRDSCMSKLGHLVYLIHVEN